MIESMTGGNCLRSKVMLQMEGLLRGPGMEIKMVLRLSTCWALSWRAHRPVTMTWPLTHRDSGAVKQAAARDPDNTQLLLTATSGPSVGPTTN